MTKNSVFEELGFSKEEARILEMKTDLVNKITAIVKRKGYTQNQLKEILGVPQPRVSELLRHKISSTSVEKLLTYLERLGCETSFKFHEKKVG
jgi:predicted XRE-type DNA-binding protein